MTAWCQENENLHPSNTMLWNLKGETNDNFSSMHAQPWKIDVGPEPLPTPPISTKLNQCFNKTWLHDWLSTPTKILKLKGETVANFCPAHVHPFRDDVGPRPAGQAALGWALLAD